MSRTMSFSFDTEEEKAEFGKYAKEKGMTLSTFAKMALYSYRSKYPQKRTRKEGVKLCGKEPLRIEAVQPYTSEDNRDDG